MKKSMERMKELMGLGGTKKDIILLVISGIALLLSLSGLPLSFDAAWIAMLLCGMPDRYLSLSTQRCY